MIVIYGTYISGTSKNVQNVELWIMYEGLGNRFDTDKMGEFHPAQAIFFFLLVLRPEAVVTKLSAAETADACGSIARF